MSINQREIVDAWRDFAEKKHLKMELEESSHVYYKRTKYWIKVTSEILMGIEFMNSSNGINSEKTFLTFKLPEESAVPNQKVKARNFFGIKKKNLGLSSLGKVVQDFDADVIEKKKGMIEIRYSRAIDELTLLERIFHLVSEYELKFSKE